MNTPIETTSPSAKDTLVNATTKKKLIEVSLPLQAINRAAERETRIRSGHPKSIHQWWSRKPLATSRAVIFAQLVDDPSAHPERFPTEEEQDAERVRLHQLIGQLAQWEVGHDPAILTAARDEIRRSNGGASPRVLDPFAGAGSIPLEAQRLGAVAAASDLNPVSVLINRALIQAPRRFAGRVPVHPDISSTIEAWAGASGLAADLERYGAWMRDTAFERIGSLYPRVAVAGGTEHTVIAWIWARTVRSPNPANPIEVPLVNSWWLSKKKGRETYIDPAVEDGAVTYHVRRGKTGIRGGTVERGNGVSVADGTPFPASYVRDEAAAGRMGQKLMAIAAEGPRIRVYADPSPEHERAAQVERPSDFLAFDLPVDPRAITAPNYGMTRWCDLYTDRQLVLLQTMTKLVGEARSKVLQDAVASGLPLGSPFEDGGTGAAAYADAMALFLALAVDKLADLNNALASWEPLAECPRHLFVRPAIPMSWEFAEANPFSNSSGSFMQIINGLSRVFPTLGPWEDAAPEDEVERLNAATRDYSGYFVSTDPPYYDNIGYADLSDFFYVILRESLAEVFPRDFTTMLAPKSDEIVSNPQRHGGKSESERFFVESFNSVFGGMRRTGSESPMTVYYAYKQKESKDGAFTGWHTLLQGLISEGWEITATWPVLTEGVGRMRAHSSNALESTVLLACRPRPQEATSTTRREFTRTLRTELPDALRKLMHGEIAPVDLAQAAIGPGISVFSRYARVREADGSDMTVKDALLIVNATLDEVLGEQESDFDPDTRFAVKWYRQFAWSDENSGTADQLARSSDTTVGALERGGIFEAKGGKARLIPPSRLDGSWDPAADSRVSVWEATIRLAALMAKGGADSVARLLPVVEQRIQLDAIRELAFLLFHEAEKKKEAKDALLFNGLVSAWGDVREQSRAEALSPRPVQQGFDFDEDED